MGELKRKEKVTAIVLAGGSGKRMGQACKKQYILLAGKPLLSYSLQAFQKSSVDEIILVSNEAEYCQKEIIEKYCLDKVKKIVPGGAERYHSVYQGLCAADDSDFVLIHDGARPFLTEEMIERSIQAAKEFHACAVGMPVKDTIKIADDEGFALQTPERSRVWCIQTPQAFAYTLIRAAYETALKEEPQGITDDAMVVEYSGLARVKLIRGDYRNIKITTPEDLLTGEAFLLNGDRTGS